MRRETWWAVGGVAIVALVMVVVLRWEGRIGWCACGEPRPWVGDPNSAHNSQHLFDPYSFSHLLHGVLFCGLLSIVRGNWSPERRFAASAALEAAWEVLENSPFVIDRYRTATIAVGYAGDSIVNSLGDLLSCQLGFVLARRIGWYRSAAVCAAVEVVMLLAIRDNLTLNVLMLLLPLDAVKAWQAG